MNKVLLASNNTINIDLINLLTSKNIVVSTTTLDDFQSNYEEYIMVFDHNMSKQFKKQKRELKQGDPIKVAFHKCTVCGKTEVSDPDAEFRYCSKCNGNYEYCMDHLHNHEHKQ